MTFQRRLLFRLPLTSHDDLSQDCFKWWSFDVQFRYVKEATIQQKFVLRNRKSSLTSFLLCTVKWRVDLAPKKGPKRVSPVCYWLRVNSAPLKRGCCWHPFLGLNWSYCKGQIGPCEGSIWRILEPLWNLKGPIQPQNVSPLKNYPFKNSQFSSDVKLVQKWRALSSLHRFPPLLSNNENNPHSLSFKYSFIRF